MVSKGVVLETIRKMIDSGIDDSIIVQTLKDTGLSDDEIEGYIEEVRGTGSDSGPEDRKPAKQEREIRQQSPEQETQELLHSATHNKLNEHSEKLEGVEKNVSNLHQKIDSLTRGPNNRELLNELALLNNRIATLEKQVSDAKALASASKSLLEKILDTNRKVLEKL